MRNAIILFSMMLMGAVSMGCTRESTSSQNIKTQGMAADIDVTAESDTNSHVLVDLTVGGTGIGATGVILEGGDKLEATVGAETKQLVSTNAGIYEADFATAAEGTEFKIALLRETDEDAPNSRGVLPAPFKITGVPAAGMSPSRATDDVVITWDPAQAGSTMNIQVDGSCIFIETFSVPTDAGSFTIPKGKLKSTMGTDNKPTTCDVDVKIERSANGTTDPIFEEGQFTLKQMRAGKFTSAP